MKLLLLFAAVSLAVVGQDYDLMIRGGRVIDGTGNPSFLADVAIQDGKIARIGSLGEAHAKRVLDAKGLAPALSTFITTRITRSSWMEMRRA